MILGSHLIFGTYGFWLPNDPRGSWSTYVGSRRLYELGAATKVTTSASLAGVPHDHQQRLAAKQLLKHPEVIFTGRQALAVAQGFAKAAQEGDYRIHACAVMPQHVHLVIARHCGDMSRIAAHLKARATQSLKKSGLWPDPNHPVWSRRRGWVVFLDNEFSYRQAIQYVEENPIKDGKPRQKWSFIVPWSE